jgi:cholest-4-en-3-one 26-monooxygenase
MLLQDDSRLRRPPMHEVDLFDSQTYESSMPHEYFAWLREHDRVHWQPPSPKASTIAALGNTPQRGFWAITRYRDVVEVSLDQELFSSERGTSIMQDIEEERANQLRLWMINQDAPRHTKLRKLINKGFTKRTTANLEPHIRELTRELVDRIAPKGECDFVESIASELPLLVIAELVGCPAEDRKKLFTWSNRMVGFDDPDFKGEGQVGDAMEEMFEYAGHLARARRSDPRDDLVTALVHAEVDGERLDDLAFNMFFILLILAGNETTRNAISGGMLAFSEHPDQLRRLQSDRSLLPSATEEILRYVSPVITMRRTATRDCELGGQAIAEGDKLVLFYPSANRDAEIFEDPDRLDIGRDEGPHLAFGWGPHFCLGANLARTEIRCIFDELLERLPDIEVCGPPRRLRSITVNSLKSLPVRFTPESRAAR